MKRLALAALGLLAVSFPVLVAADGAADEPAIRPDPRPTDLTTGRRGTSDEPKIRDEPRAIDHSSPKTSVGRSTIEVGGLTTEQSERIRAIHLRAADEIQAIRDRERAEIMALLTESQRAEYRKYEDEDERSNTLPRRATTSAAATAPSE